MNYAGEDSLNFFSFSKYPVYRILLVGSTPRKTAWESPSMSHLVLRSVTWHEYTRRKRKKVVPCGKGARTQIFSRQEDIKRCLLRVHLFIVFNGRNGKLHRMYSRMGLSILLLQWDFPLISCFSWTVMDGAGPDRFERLHWS